MHVVNSDRYAYPAVTSRQFDDNLTQLSARQRSAPTSIYLRFMRSKAGAATDTYSCFFCCNWSSLQSLAPQRKCPVCTHLMMMICASAAGAAFTNI